VRKILSIDGGGIKGVFPASFLTTIEDSIGDRVSNYFDLIVGTSTGGIIALGLGLGLPAKDILSFYEEKGSAIFKGNKLFRGVIQLFSPKYNVPLLRNALETIFKQDLSLGESTTRLVIPSFNLDTGEVHVYKTAHHQRFERDYKENVVDIALATSAAPAYFKTHFTSKGIPLIDGGIYANNPVGLSVVEAIGVLGWEKESLKVLSIGCTTEPLNVSSKKKGCCYWGLKSADVFLTAQSSLSLGTAKLLAGHENIIRISPQVFPGRFKIDFIKGMKSLKGLGDSEARKAMPLLHHIFFDKTANDFVPFYKL